MIWAIKNNWDVRLLAMCLAALFCFAQISSSAHDHDDAHDHGFAADCAFCDIGSQLDSADTESAELAPLPPGCLAVPPAWTSIATQTLCAEFNARAPPAS